MDNNLKISLQGMSRIIMEMVDLVYQGFMGNDIDLLDGVLKKEDELDNLERDFAANIVELSKALSKGERKRLVILGEVAANIERMGDELRYLIERIEIKISDRLRFSEEAVEQYKEVFETMRKSVSLIVKYLSEDKTGILNEVLENGNRIKKLVERYRTAHVERLTKGICKPRAANMYFDMLDFTGNIARHCTNTARVFKEQ